jgi:hypothetical protein
LIKSASDWCVGAIKRTTSSRRWLVETGNKFLFVPTNAAALAALRRLCLIVMLIAPDESWCLKRLRQPIEWNAAKDGERGEMPVVAFIAVQMAKHGASCLKRGIMQIRFVRFPMYLQTGAA